MSKFKFALEQAAALTLSGETGTVIGRADYSESSFHSYLLRYLAKDGSIKENWWAESCLRGETVAQQPLLTPPLPGEHWPAQGGHYAGITCAAAIQPAAHLIVLDVKPDAAELTWADATAWAEAQGNGARLPTRVESALLYANLKDQFETDEWYWTGTQYSADGAWVQDFYYGNQYGSSKAYTGRARAVRRLMLESFSPSA